MVQTAGHPAPVAVWRSGGAAGTAANGDRQATTRGGSRACDGFVPEARRQSRRRQRGRGKPMPCRTHAIPWHRYQASGGYRRVGCSARLISWPRACDTNARLVRMPAAWSMHACCLACRALRLRASTRLLSDPTAHSA